MSLYSAVEAFLQRQIAHEDQRNASMAAKHYGRELMHRLNISQGPSGSGKSWVRRIARPLIPQMSKQQAELEAPPMLITGDDAMGDSGEEGSSVGSYGIMDATVEEQIDEAEPDGITLPLVASEHQLTTHQATTIAIESYMISIALSLIGTHAALAKESLSNLVFIDGQNPQAASLSR